MRSSWWLCLAPAWTWGTEGSNMCLTLQLFLSYTHTHTQCHRQIHPGATVWGNPPSILCSTYSSALISFLGISGFFHSPTHVCWLIHDICWWCLTWHCFQLDLLMQPKWVKLSGSKWIKVMKTWCGTCLDLPFLMVYICWKLSKPLTPKVAGRLLHKSVLSWDMGIKGRFGLVLWALKMSKVLALLPSLGFGLLQSLYVSQAMQVYQRTHLWYCFNFHQGIMSTLSETQAGQTQNLSQGHTCWWSEEVFSWCLTFCKTPSATGELWDIRMQYLSALELCFETLLPVSGCGILFFWW